jgi:hypothetical protein
MEKSKGFIRLSMNKIIGSMIFMAKRYLELEIKNGLNNKKD